MRALSLTVAALTLAAALAPAPALACGMVMREPVNLAELMDEVDEVKVDVDKAEIVVIDEKSEDKTDATVDAKVDVKAKPTS